MSNLQRNSKKRTRWLALPLLLILTVVASACGNSNSARNTAGETNSIATTTQMPAETSLPTATASLPEFKTVTTVNGEIEIPTQPKRIVAEEYLGSLIALGTIPVGAPGLTLQNMYFKEALIGVQDTGEYGKMSPEAIITLSPDLIISGQAESYETLSKIAPTIIVPYGDLKDAHEELTYFGNLLGKEAEAKAWLSEYDQRIAVAKAKVDKVIPADATFSIMEDGGKSIWVYGDNFGRGGQPVYQALGRKPPSAIAAEIMEKQWAEISTETLAKYAGDYIIMTSNTLTAEDYKTTAIWSSLPAVKNGHLYVWKEERSWYYDPIAVLSQTEELADWLTQ
ncbi:ABC transporter substrate-binding protein [Paenibacillus monticola]|nr:ABC transporter substrate-binding protein [Paenibacillus monticola]